MFRFRKFWLISVGIGLLVGLSVTGWLYWQKSQQAPVDRLRGSGTQDGTISLNLSGSSSNSGATLPVVTDGDQGSAIDSTSGGEAAGTGQSSSSSGNPDSESSAGSSGSLPGPSGFTQYNAYKNSPTALFIDVQVGSGKAIAQGSVATVQYEGWLTNGTEFDSTYARKQAFTFTEGSGQLIPGWQEAIYGMKVGGERRLIVPPGLAFGTTGHTTIPANSVLIFDVALVSIK